MRIMPWNYVPDAHGAYWFHCRADATVWSQGPGEAYDWFKMQHGVNPPWVLEQQRQQLNAMRMPNAHPIAIPPSQEDDAGSRRQQDARRVTFATMPEENAKPVEPGEDTAVAEASGHPRNSCTPALATDALPKAPSTGAEASRHPRNSWANSCVPALAIDDVTKARSTRTERVINVRIRTCGGSTNGTQKANKVIEAPREHPQASVATAATAPRQPRPVPEFPPPGRGVEVQPPPPVRPAAELEPISTTDERFRDLMVSNRFRDHPFTRWMEGERAPRPCVTNVWFLHDFEAYDEVIGFSECDRSNYNVALKYFRDIAQNKFEGRNMLLPTSPIAIPQLTRPGKGAQFAIDHESTPHAFVWVEMIAHLSKTLRDDQTQTDMALVVGAGIESCVFKKDPVMYDHKIYQILSKEKKDEMKTNGTLETTWDFLLCRRDGSACALHPDFSKNSITYREVRGPGGEQLCTTAPLVPKAGPGKSDGHGTFQRMVRQTEQKRLKFDTESFVKPTRDA